MKTGKYRAGDETKDGVDAPDEVCDSFADFVYSLLSAGSSKEYYGTDLEPSISGVL